MALTDIQRQVCQLLAQHRIESGESYVAGGAALGVALGSTRISHDVDLFHDTLEALAKTWAVDRELLIASGFEVEVRRSSEWFVDASARRGGEEVQLQWAHDSAYRFFPLVTHPDFGLTMNPFDLATNKTLALVGRLAVRDWIDVIECSEKVQPLGHLAWAACGKDPGFGPAAILEHAARSGRYTQVEVDQESFDGPTPDAGQLARRWKSALNEAREIVLALPPEHAGKAVLTAEGELFRGGVEDIPPALAADALVFHEGSIRGAFPTLR